MKKVMVKEEDQTETNQKKETPKSKSRKVIVDLLIFSNFTSAVYQLIYKL